MVLSISVGANAQPMVAQGSPYKFEKKTFSGTVPAIAAKKSTVTYDFALANEAFLVGIPTDYNPRKSYGLFVYMSPTDGGTFRPDWFPTLAKQDLLIVAPMNAGNSVDPSKRMGLGIVATVLMKRDYNINSKQVFVAGLSGGARMANSMAFLHPELYKGALMNCGGGFPAPVPVNMVDKNDPNQTNYGGIFGQEQVNPTLAKSRVKFAFTTGKGDFRYANIQDIFNGGYKAKGYRAMLYDVEGMGHTDCDPWTLNEALNFLKK